MIGSADAASGPTTRASWVRGSGPTAVMTPLWSAEDAACVDMATVKVAAATVVAGAGVNVIMGGRWPAPVEAATMAARRGGEA
ncbi:hypothetical protein Afil01_21830 [Actinorhabdospora filicis]|uniref:Uncharacterized protein n=1 Tax=Actinorhabdospora filicis TaxID=1785913 RepID=A0A9W6W9C4_9ACTN|nr:hypothetical protein Afil01_21830 [Actinorhabdospora filicis]